MNNLSPELLYQLFSHESDDPFLILLTLTNPALPGPIRMVNNSEDIISRGNTFMKFPFKVKFPVDDGETARDFTIEFDNVSLSIIDEMRSIQDPMDVKLEMILASMPDDVQFVQEELKIQSISYNQTRISAKIVMDSFLQVEMTSERYTPSLYPGIF